jgi:hypothetical protein
MTVVTANKKFGLYQMINGYDSARLIGMDASFSLRAACSAVGTARANKLRAAIISWQGTVDAWTADPISAWGAEDTAPTLVANYTYESTPFTLHLTTTWQNHLIGNVAIDTASTKNVGLLIWSDDQTTTVGDIVYVADVTLVRGQIPMYAQAEPYRLSAMNAGFFPSPLYLLRQNTSGDGGRLQFQEGTTGAGVDGVFDYRTSGGKRYLRGFDGSVAHVWRFNSTDGEADIDGSVMWTDANTDDTSGTQQGRVDSTRLRSDSATDANRAVQTNHIRDLAVTEAKINALAVTSGKIGALAVIAGKIADGGVDTTARLANSIVTPAKIATLPFCRVHRNTTVQSISHNSETAVLFTTEDADTDTMHDTGSNTDRITCTTAGRYSVEGNVSWDTGVTGTRYLMIKKNGSAIARVQTECATTGENTHQHVSTKITMAATDYFTLHVYQFNAGTSALNLLAAANAYPTFCAAWEGP